MTTNCILIGGNYGENNKSSSVANKLFDELKLPGQLINGGSLERFKEISIENYNLIVWMPNLNNEIEKIYPKKTPGSVLICSKVIRENRSEIDAISRIFKMQGNAVIAIYPGEIFSFKLIDALGNVWYSGSDLKSLAFKIKILFEWTTSSIRQKTKPKESTDPIIFPDNLTTLLDLNKILADKFEVSCGRFFGNTSTRCMKMFPSQKRNLSNFFVSKRNSDKKRLTPEDMILVEMCGDTIWYSGNDKPSVDTPIQANIYKSFPDINFMIHGHGYIKEFKYTKNYFPCGDLREFFEFKECYDNNPNGGINLIHHGFLIYAKDLSNLERLVLESSFEERKIGNEICTI